MAVEITRRELSASELRREAARAKDAKASRRMLALAFVLDGRSRTEAAQSCGMDRQTLRSNACVRRVYRYNEEGLAGLVNRSLPGRTPMLSAEQMGELAELVEAGPDPEADRVIRWRRIDLCHVVERRFGLRVAERTMGSILRRLGFAKLSARPRHPQSDPEARELYKNGWPAPSARALFPAASDRSASTYTAYRNGRRRQDGDPRVPSLINFTASSRHLFNQAFETPVNRQAIFQSPPADIVRSFSLRRPRTNCLRPPSADLPRTRRPCATSPRRCERVCWRAPRQRRCDVAWPASRAANRRKASGSRRETARPLWRRGSATCADICRRAW